MTIHLIQWLKEQEPFDLIILDPIYKINDGDENSARDMTIFCNALERLASDTGAAVAFVHHFSKGMQGGKASIDRASGSGVFGRDPDAIATLTELKDIENGYKLEWTLREFITPDPICIQFNYPIHTVIEADNHEVVGETNKGGRPKKEITQDQIKEAIDILSIDNHKVTNKDLAEYFGVSERKIQSVKSVKN
jgi:RecA-family ATPase